MPTTITHATGTITPLAVEGYRSSRAARTVVHDVLSGPSPDVDLRPFSLRSGSFRLVFDSEAAALSAEAALAMPQTLAIANDQVAALNFSFVISDGDIDLEQDDDDPDIWRVIIPYREVL